MVFSDGDYDSLTVLRRNLVMVDMTEHLSGCLCLSDCTVGRTKDIKDGGCLEGWKMALFCALKATFRVDDDVLPIVPGRSVQRNTVT